MQSSTIELDNYEVSPNRAKFPTHIPTPDSNPAETYAAEGLSQLNSKLDGNSTATTIVTSAHTPENALAPQKVRTERYVKVSVKNMSVTKQKSLFLSWFLDNNGLPDCALLLIPERHPNVIISFKGTHGWIEIDTAHCKAPDYEIQFELKLHHAFLNRRRYVQNQPIVLRFFLLDKKEDGTINTLGEVLLSVLLMSSKCANRTLIAHFIKEDKMRDLAQYMLSPERKQFELQESEDDEIPSNNNNSSNASNNPQNNSNQNSIISNSPSLNHSIAALAHHHQHQHAHSQQQPNVHHHGHLPQHNRANNITSSSGNSSHTNNHNGLTHGHSHGHPSHAHSHLPHTMAHSLPHLQTHSHTNMNHSNMNHSPHNSLNHPHSSMGAHNLNSQHLSHSSLNSLNPQVLSHLQTQGLYGPSLYTGNQN